MKTLLSNCSTHRIHFIDRNFSLHVSTSNLIALRILIQSNSTPHPTFPSVMLKRKDNPTENIQEENVVEEKIYCLLGRKETKVWSSGRIT